MVIYVWFLKIALSIFPPLFLKKVELYENMAITANT